MAEVLGITASIIAVIQLASQVATMSYSYIGRAKRASKEVSQLVGELNSLKEVLLILEKYIKDNPGSSVIQKLDRSIRGCSQDLEHLKGKLEPRKGIRQVMDRFKWPMMDGVIAKAQSRIERHKTLFLLALSVDQMLLAKKNEQNTKDTYHGIKTQYEDFWKKEKRIKVLDWLTNENFEKKHTEIRNKRQEGTGEWLLVDPEFEKWFIEGCSLLWGFGIPGAGKTFLSSAVIDHLHLQKKVIVAYIYFDYKEEEQQRPVHVLESLVKQLASQLPDLPKDLEALHDDLERERRRPTTDELNKVLLTIIDSSCGKMFLVFDALDECDQDGQRKELLSLLHFMAGYYSVFVTSRQHPEDIQESFQYSAKIRLSANEDDIKRYIEHKIDGNTRARRLVEQGNCRERIISELIGCASGMFLLAHFHIEHLCQQTTAKQILSALDQLRIPSTGKRPLDPTYDRAMNTMLNQPPSCADLGLMVLSWLVRSRRTLKTEELRLAVSVKQDRYELDELDLPDKATILDVCAGLVMADESGTIRLVHYTVQEYLTNNPTVSQDADFRIAMTCTTFLSFSIFAQDIPTPYSSPQSWIAYHPFLRYAATHLSSHLNACDENLTTDLVLKFISSPNCIDNYLRFLLRRRKNYNYQRLLMWECRKSTSQKLQPLHLASYLGHLPIVHSLLGQKESLPIHEPGMWTPLHFAAYEGWEKVVLLLLNYEADWSIGDRFGQTPLHIAASEGHKAVVEALLGKGADLSIKDFRGKTALDLTLKDRFVEVARVLLGRGAEPETTAIFDAAFDGQEAIVEVLLESGANITARDTKGDTVLHLAARGGYLSLVRLLLDKGAKSSAINRCGDTALHTAVLEGRKETVQLLLEGDAEAETTVLVLNDTGETALHNAALLGDERSVRILLDKGAKHSTPNNYRDTPLHNALSRGYGMIVEMLLDSGADSCDVSNCYGITPLQLAASKGNLTFVESFLVGGADLSKSDCYGDTALSFAAAMGHKEVVRLLLEKGADFSRQNKLGNTALHKAALRDHEEVVQLLLENGADWSIQNAYGDTVLHLAAGNGHVVVVELLLNSSGGVGLAAQNNGGDTALHQAASEGKYRVLEVLLEAGVDLSVVNNSESTALHYAAWGGHQVCLKLLLKWGFKPSAQDKHGNTALHTAARRGYTAIVETLLENGADTSAKNFDGDTALHYAAWKGYVPVVELLLKKGANPFVSNRLRNTPLHIAVSYENFVVGGILYEVLRARAREETVIRTQAE